MMRVNAMQKEKITLGMKFALNPDCFLVKGAKRGAIYNLGDGNVYSIDEVGLAVLTGCESGASLQKIDICSQEDIVSYLLALEKSKLGEFTEKQQLLPKIQLIAPEKRLYTIWLELTQRCNLKCLHCYSESKADNKGGGNLGLDDWKRLVFEAHQEGAGLLQLIGGEPMFSRRTVHALIKLAKSIGYERIEIFTNATLLTDTDIDFFAEYNVKVATSVYSKRAEIHDSITQRKGSFEATAGNVRKLAKKGIKTKFALVVMRQNEQYIKETLEYLRSLGEVDISRCFDVARSVGRGKSPDLLTEDLEQWMKRKRPVFGKITREKFANNIHGHECWGNKAAIFPNGQVSPCIMARKEGCIAGDTRDKPLSEVIHGKKMNEMKNMSKDKIKICKDCEYRYICPDCRPLVFEETCDLYARGNHCLYDPYKGMWQTNSTERR